jgi:hypothetical protein
MTVCSGEDGAAASQPGMGGEFILDCFVYRYAQIHCAGDVSAFQHPLANNSLGQTDALPWGVAGSGSDGLADQSGKSKIAIVDLRDGFVHVCAYGSGQPLEGQGENQESGKAQKKKSLKEKAALNPGSATPLVGGAVYIEKPRCDRFIFHSLS